ncbi:MAG: phospholipase D family protein [Alicyclobacillus sp.]|nr:phospholipase D family protein [Alicyclobacillus sp.]
MKFWETFSATFRTLFHTQRGKRVVRCLFGMALSLGVVGCSRLLPSADVQQFPKPVTARGMTFAWGGDVKTAALRLIRASKRYCYLDMYELSDPQILHALATTRERGVDVRIVLDATEPHSQQVGLPTLQRDGVPVETLHIPQGISHIKMLVTDAGVLVGGMNFGAASWHNNDGSVIIAQPGPTFLALFRWDWTRATGTPAAAPAYMPPLLDDRATEQAVVNAIGSARRSVDMEAFDLSDRAVLAALVAAADRGVQVEVLLDPGQYLNRKAADTLRATSAIVRFYRPYQNEWMHAKMLDVDDGTIFIIGSANFSHQAYAYNHEGDIELFHVPAFDQSFRDNLAQQIARGTDYPISTSSTT